MARPSRIIVELGARAVMRDGVPLVADVYRPDTVEPVPAIVMRTPYDRGVALTEPFYDLLRFVKAGYALVVQDTRGRYESGGEFHPFRTEREDGVDTVAWVRGAPWSNGRVGMIGASYPGATQWLTATQNPPGLDAICPIVTAADYRDGWILHDGAFEMGFSLQWAIWLAGDAARRREAADPSLGGLSDRVLDVGDRVESLYRSLDPDAEALLRELTPYYAEWQRTPADDAAWERLAPDLRPELARAPALNIGGWYDLFLTGAVDAYRRQRDAAREAGRPGPRLVIGPWTHSVYSGMFVGRRFGTRSAIGELDLAGEQLRWFDRWLRDEPNGIDEAPPVRVFVMGTDRWRDLADFPPPEANATPLFLHAPADGPWGALASRQPDGEDGGLLLRFDPSDLVPTLGGGTLLEGTWVGDRAGPADLRPLAMRPDVLIFATEPLDRAITVIGGVEWVGHATVSADAGRGFDLVAHLVDVHPSGRMELLANGVRRVPAGAAPGPVSVRVGATAAVFPPGHRVVLLLAASDFPRFEPNPDLTAAGGGAIRIGCSGRERPRLVLPIVEG